ncbi:hypothetical protein NDI76_13990 [Halogeometricum sp. S1BR25-6]|uniref:Uncharacterized protein n=1 Tax=Halogeometricum salsisoli TaxID=2950536 RepID=A0ABU2GGE7_9EURY|nr:hypothetical protein [Halogeometricum sp. S1BR25-6]MDS0299855.1 hypothetical protein [Halogeometricum sp. S1BR25-6]
MRADTMCHHYESNPEWEALVEKQLRAEFEEDDGLEESPDRADPPLADD